ncbi:MAG TPA: hypothetical protein VGU24_21990 [Microvirga sp.]|jgi:hypothetical protein|nr:hypothetical protein [Microvirga sp.]
MPMDLAGLLASKPLARGFALSPEIAETLHALVITEPAAPDAATVSGKAQLGAARKLLGFFDLTIDPALLPQALYCPFEYHEENGGFWLDVDISAAGAAQLFEVAGPALGLVLKPAKKVTDGAGRTLKEVLEPDPAFETVTIDGLRAVMRFSATAGEAVVRRDLLPPSGAADELLVVTPKPAYVMFGETGFGLGLTGGIVIDDRADKAPPGVPGHRFASNDPSWRGLAIRGAELFIPKAVPLLGGRAIPISFELGKPAGIDGRITVTLPGEGSRPDITARVEWHDPAATSLADCLPTLVELTAEFKIANEQSPLDDAEVPSIKFAGGDPLRVRARYSRDPAGASRMRFDLALEADGPDGVVAVRIGDEPERIFVTAATLATALVADPKLPENSGADASGKTLHALLVSASALSTFFGDRGSVVIHGVELSSEGERAPVGGDLRLRLDYSLAAVVKQFDAGPLAIGMNGERPMRLRCRNVFLTVKPGAPGLKMFDLGFDDAQLEIEDPGAWTCKSPGSLLDVIGVRNGRGSLWIDVDLRCRLDLGPLKVSGATVRLTLAKDIEPTLRGLDIAVDVPGAVKGRGALRLVAGEAGAQAVDALLSLELVPLKLRATGEWLQDGPLTALRIRSDLPGPIPLANSGLGLFGVGGMFGVNAGLRGVPPGADPVVHYLGLLPELKLPQVLERHPGGAAFGLSVRIGTLPDMGIAFMGEGAVMLGVPDFALRAALHGAVLGALGQLKGVLAIDAEALTVALQGTYKVPLILDMTVPFGAHFPFTDGKRAKWYVHLGTFEAPGRTGPIRAEVLPGLPIIGNIEGWAFVMIEGDGLILPALVKSPMNLPGFAVGCGLGFSCDIGVGPVGFEFGAVVVAGLGTRPLIVAAQAKVEGSLNLGPVSISAYADASMILSGATKWAEFEVCGEVDLWLTTLRGCANLSIGSQTSEKPPPPNPAPAISMQLVDRRYSLVGEATPTEAGAPVVWTDVIPVILFEVGPASRVGDGAFAAWLNGIDGTGNVNASDGICGTEALKYEYSLTKVDLVEVGPGGETTLAGPFEAMWQLPRDVLSNATGKGGRELALLTLNQALWSHRLSDPTRAPLNPAPIIATGCERTESAQPGWARAEDGERPGARWRWPVRPAVSSRFDSRFGVEVRSFFTHPITGRRVAFDPLLTSFLPGAAIMVGGELVEAPAGIRPADGRPPLVEALRSPGIAGEDRDRALRNVIEIQLAILDQGFNWSEPVIDPDLWISFAREDADEERLTVSDDLGQPWQPRRREVDGHTLMRFAPPASDPPKSIRTVRLTYPWGLRFNLLAFRGTTVAAAGAAVAFNKAVNGAREAQAQANKVPIESRKPFLQPGKTYRVDLAVAVSGSRKDGPNKLAVSETFPEIRRSFHFTTASNAIGPLVVPGVKGSFLIRMQDQNAFEPERLGRYLGGYEPADRSQFVFCDDEVRVDFIFDHVIGMAALHGYDFQLCLKRTDMPARIDTSTTPNGPLPVLLSALETVTMGSPVEAEIARLKVVDASTCPTPAAGLRARAPVRLARAASYDLAAGFNPKTDKSSLTLLPGAAFTTSRYRTPQELIEDLLGPAGPGQSGVDGDLRIDGAAVLPSPAASDVTSDAALDRVLGHWKLTPWPGLGRRTVSVFRQGGTDWLARGSPPPGATLVKTLSEVPRTTALWTQAASGWAVVAVILESPEPIQRPDRLTDSALTLGGSPFEHRVSNHAGTRILFATSRPIGPKAGDRLSLSMTDVNARRSIEASTSFAVSPAFAEEVA